MAMSYNIIMHLKVCCVKTPTMYSLVVLLCILPVLLFPAFSEAGVLEDLNRELYGDRNDSGANIFDVGAMQKLPTILMKKQQKVKNDEKPSDVEVVNVDPADCVETIFMNPWHDDVIFPDKEKVAEAKNSTHCSWSFIGTEVCTPKLTCSTFKLSPDCDSQYLEVSDGVLGGQRYCGDEGPQNIVAANDLRDLYITLNGTLDANFELSCTVTCTDRGRGTELPQNAEIKEDNTCICGEKPRTDRIVNGYAARKSEYPWLVAVVEAQTRQPFCGASIINDRYILTAAHCFKGKYMDYRRVQLLLQAEVLDVMPNSGVQSEKADPRIYTQEMLEQLDKGNGTIRLTIDEITVHPLYVSETNDFDVALIKTVERINITTKSQRPVCLPTLGSYGQTWAHRQAIVAGWGLPSTEAPGTSAQLQKLNITVFSQSLCKEYYSHRINKRMMCAGYKEGGRDSCMGDSGGPLTIQNDKVWTQIGTVSWGEGCAVAENPGVYYRLTEVGQWINHVSNTNDAVWCAMQRPAKRVL